MFSTKFVFADILEIRSWKNSTLRSVSQRGVTYFPNISAKKSKTILTCLSGAQVDSIHEEKKIAQKYRDTATLIKDSISLV